MKDTIHAFCIMLMVKLQGFLHDEKGDTNFISILIILGVVVVLAGVFIGFKDKIVAEVQSLIDGFTIS